MRTRRKIWLTALAFVAIVGAAVAAAPDEGPAAAHHHHHDAARHDGAHGSLQERFLYVSTIAQSKTDPDFIAVVGADPRHADYGKIVDRVDMPNVGDELHHYGYSADQKRLLVPGLFSNRIHVFDIKGNGRKLKLRAVNDELAAK